MREAFCLCTLNSNQYLCGFKLFALFMSTQHLSEQEQLRREKLAELIMMGIEPYPAPLFPVNSNSVYIKANYKEETKEQFQEVKGDSGSTA